MRQKGAAALALLILAASGCGGPEGRVVPNAEPDPGRLCVPVDASGQASIAWETIRPQGEDPVTVTGVSVDRAGVEVADWFLTPEEWEGGVRSGRFPDPGRVKLGARLDPGRSTLVAFTLRSKGTPPPQAMKVRVAYEVDGASSSTTLAWPVRLVPHGTTCKTGG